MVFHAYLVVLNEITLEHDNEAGVLVRLVLQLEVPSPSVLETKLDGAGSPEFPARRCR